MTDTSRFDALLDTIQDFPTALKQRSDSAKILLGEGE